MNHQKLTKKAAAWLRKNGFKATLTEFRSLSNEEPDAFGFNGAVSCVIESKVSRADFLADQKKSFRRNPDSGMGVYRYFITPKGLISPEELPLKWGLLEVHGRKTVCLVEAQAFELESALKAERELIFSLVRRLLLEDADLMNVAVDVSKLRARLNLKYEQLKFKERDLRKEEQRYRFRKRQLEELIRDTDFGPVLARKIK